VLCGFGSGLASSQNQLSSLGVTCSIPVKIPLFTLDRSDVGHVLTHFERAFVVPALSRMAK